MAAVRLSFVDVFNFSRIEDAPTAVVFAGTATLVDTVEVEMMLGEMRRLLLLLLLLY